VRDVVAPSHRRVDYLRLSVTDRCNLRCVYCMPEQGVPYKPHEQILSYEDMVFFVDAVRGLGIGKVRLTGGEPLVRKNLPYLVRRVAALPGIEDVSLTTNGILLPRFAAELADAGLSRVNVSLDSLDSERYRRLTRGGRLDEALAGIEAAFAHGLTPVKLNAVMLPELIQELDAFVELTREHPLHVRFIEWMQVGGCGPREEGERLSRVELLAALSERGALVPVASPGGFGPARYFRLEGHAGTLGVISSVSDHFCGDCNRLRLTADARLKSCLFSEEETDVSVAVRGRDREGLLALVNQVLGSKTYARPQAGVGGRGMSQIGG